MEWFCSAAIKHNENVRKTLITNMLKIIRKNERTRVLLLLLLCVARVGCGHNG